MSEKTQSEGLTDETAAGLGTFSARLRRAIGDESVSAFARQCGLGESLLRSYLAGSAPGLDKAAAIARAADVSLWWLATGEGPPGAAAAEGAAPYDPGFVMVPRYDMAASAGAGAFNDHHQVVDHMIFHGEWLRRALGVAPDKLVLVTAAGDSMEPTLRAGDLLLVDRSVERVADDRIYLVERAGRLAVRRLQRLTGSDLAVRSDNPAYQEETLAGEALDRLDIAGRVCWIARIV